ncbi:uncharacterized protein LOC105427329 [Pogonomyrmex barbatus]|uniref:Uncharacterized protein LOC105427329 n=1 Tax=Pogonomyrmex barbatus TaxID=144034 RepID=A0A6I9W5M0_9HYME|nr:uncharacterized protein LOC105427329 [Pogonomyrmex barbatus]
MKTNEHIDYKTSKMENFNPSKVSPKCRRPLRKIENNSLNNNSQSLQLKEEQPSLSNEESEESFEDQNIEQMQLIKNNNELDNEVQLYPGLQNHSSSPKKENNSKKSKDTKPVIKQETNLYKFLQKFYKILNFIQNINNSYIVYIFIAIIAIVIVLSQFNIFKIQTQTINNPTSLLYKFIERIRTKFHNQKSDTWNDISSAIQEVSKNPKKPSIILLFANDITTMDCLANELAHVSRTILNADSHLVFNPKDFGNDAGEIINTLNEYSPEEKKVVMIRDILNINVEAIKDLHNLCDRINPLIAEVIYIFTVQTNSYHSPQKKLDFIEKQIYNKLSRSINQDILAALVTRITDGVIVLVQSEPNLKYC